MYSNAHLRAIALHVEKCPISLNKGKAQCDWHDAHVTAYSYVAERSNSTDNLHALMEKFFKGEL